MKDPIKELEAAAAPLVKFIKDNYHPHTLAIVDDRGVNLLMTKIEIPIVDTNVVTTPKTSLN